MTWEEIVELLIAFGEKVHVVRGDGLDTVSLQVVPVGWFIAMKSAGVLNMGTYEGDDNRLVGTQAIPFAELTPDFLREEVSTAFGKQIAEMLDPEAVRDFLSRTKPPRF